LKNAEIIEIKQGPYVSIKNDKIMIQWKNLNISFP
jgi:hypothetical protein